jgi:hypothetical protein
LTVPDDFPSHLIYAVLRDEHSGPENAVRVDPLVSRVLERYAVRVDDRRLREWLEKQREYPITSNDKGFWLCTCKHDWFPAIRYSVKCFLGYKHRWMHQVWMMTNFHPKHDKLFDDERYGRAA